MVVFVRPACEQDLAGVVDMYAAAIRAMRGTPEDIDWDLSWHPTAEGLARATAAGELLVAVDEAGADDAGETPLCPASGTPSAILGACVVNGSQEPDYALAAWPVDAAPSEVATLHLLASAPAARGRGVARALIAAAAEAGRARRARALRLDVFDNNHGAAAAYLACGFVDCGVFTLGYSEGFTHAAHLMELAL